MDLYFFHDMDIVLLTVEVAAGRCRSPSRRTLCFPPRPRLSGRMEQARASAALREPRGMARRSRQGPRRLRLREARRCLAAVCHNRWPGSRRTGVPPRADGSTPVERSGRLRYRHLEDYRIPGMGYFAMRHPNAVTRADYVRLGLNTGPGPSEELPYSDAYLARFEADHCHDRFYDPERRAVSGMRLTCSARGLTMVTGASPAAFDPERASLASSATVTSYCSSSCASTERPFSCNPTGWRSR